MIGVVLGFGLVLGLGPALGFKVRTRQTRIGVCAVIPWHRRPCGRENLKFITILTWLVRPLGVHTADYYIPVIIIC